MRREPGLLALATVLITAPAFAAGYDTPILYSARHMGMGGTGVSWVSDPTALFMNPAGIGATEMASLTLNVDAIIATISAVPELDTPSTAGPAVLTPFLFGASIRVCPMCTVGFGFYPVASASGGYEYTSKSSGVTVKDETTIRFYEIPVAFAFNYKDYVRFGIEWRVTLAALNRLKKNGDVSFFELDTSGVDFKGFRLGLQVQPVSFLSFGVTYRHRVDVDAKADDGKALTIPVTEVVFPLILPSRLAFGTRLDVPVKSVTLGLSIDAEYAWQSQNDKVGIETKELPPVEVYYYWTDAWTFRWGAEVGFLENWAARVGYVWDQKTSNPQYSSSFGTPPADTTTVTLGGGYKAKNWELNLAYAYRNGSVEITPEDVAGREKTCLTCSSPGNHEITLHGSYLDFSWYFDLPSSVSSWSPKAE